MATIGDLYDRIEELRVNIPQIKSFIFDDKSIMNQDTQVDYPLLLVRVPDSTWEDRKLEVQIFDIEMFMWGSELSDDVNHWTFKLATIEDYLIKLIRGFNNDNQFVIVKPPSFERAHFTGNDKLIGISATFQLKVYYGC